MELTTLNFLLNIKGYSEEENDSFMYWPEYYFLRNTLGLMIKD